MGVSWITLSISEVLAYRDMYEFFRKSSIEIPSSAKANTSLGF